MIYDGSGQLLQSAYSSDGSAAEIAYDISGNIVYESHSISPYENYTIAEMSWTAYGGLQGLVYYDGKLFMCTGDNELKVCNAETGAKIGDTLSVGIEHANSLAFSDEFYSESDSYPLLCNAITELGYFRVSNAIDSAEKVASYLLEPTSKTSTVWYGLGFYDQHLFVIGYTNGGYQNSSGNRIILAEYDLQNPIDNGDDTYTLPLVREVIRSWFECIQGSCIHDGFFWVTSGITNPGHVYALSLSTAEILLDIPMEEYSTYEIEGCTWKDNQTLIVGLRQSGDNKGMFTVTFPDIEV